MMKLIIMASKSVPLKRQGIAERDERDKRKGQRGVGMAVKGKNEGIRKRWKGGEEIGGRAVKKMKVCTALQWQQQASENRFNSGSVVHLCPVPPVNLMFQKSGNVLLEVQRRIWSPQNLSVQCSGELLSRTEDSAPRNLWRFKLQNSDKDPFPEHTGRFGNPCLARFLWAQQRRKASELWERVCVLVSLLVGLGILSKLVRLMRGELTGCSLVCLLVFWLVLF